MPSAENQTPVCPICNQSDQVKTMQAAYDLGVGRSCPTRYANTQSSYDEVCYIRWRYRRYLRVAGPHPHWIRGQYW